MLLRCPLRPRSPWLGHFVFNSSDFFLQLNVLLLLAYKLSQQQLSVVFLALKLESEFIVLLCKLLILGFNHFRCCFYKFQLSDESVLLFLDVPRVDSLFPPFFFKFLFEFSELVVEDSQNVLLLVFQYLSSLMLDRLNIILNLGM